MAFLKCGFLEDCYGFHWISLFFLNSFLYQRGNYKEALRRLFEDRWVTFRGGRGGEVES